MKLRIGELAQRSGLSVRTLHHYDAIGLLRPSERTSGGARLYGHQDFRRLHRIQVLKRLGWALADVRRVLDDNAVDPMAVIDQQARLLDAQAKRAQALSETLRHLSGRLATGLAVESADWLNLLEMMTLHEQHLTQEELRLLRSPAHGTAREIEAERSLLVAQVGDCMRKRMRADGTRAGELAWRWVDMVIALTSNNAALEQKLRTLQQRDPRAQDIVGIDAAMLEWIGQAIVHARVRLFGKYMSPEQAARLRRRQLAHREEWPPLVALVRQQMAAGTPSGAGPMRLLAARWRRLFLDSYCGDDKELEACVRRALSAEPRLSIGVGVDEELKRYVHAAIAATAQASP